MANFNQCTFAGNITRDPQLKYLPSEVPVCELGLAINHKFTTKTGEKREEVCFIDITAFGKQAETLNKYVKKGDPLLVTGRLKLDTWDDKNGGGKRSKHGLVVDGFQFLGGKSDAQDEGGY